MKKLTLVLLACVSIALTGCANNRPKKPEIVTFDNTGIQSILIVPVLNETHEALAGGLMSSTLSLPLAEKGYYTFPVRTVKTVLEQEGYYEAAQVHQLGPEKLAKMFGADSVLLTKVTFWDAQYAVIKTVTAVTVDFKLYRKDGTLLFEDTCSAAYSPQSATSQGGNPLIGLVADMVAAAVQRALPDYLPLANIVNVKMLKNFKDGPYLIKKKEQLNRK